MARAEESFIMSGQVYAGLGASGALVEIGNCSAVTLANTERVEKLKNYTGGGGTRAVFRETEAVELAVTMTDLFSDPNMLIALFGSKTAVAATTQTSESQTAPSDVSLDPLVPTDYIIDTDQTVTVTGTGGTPTYVAGTDYTVQSGGIIILNGGSISASTALEITYDNEAVDVIQALVNSAQEYRVVIQNRNEAQSGDPMRIICHKVIFGPAAELSLISESFGELALTGEVLQDATQGAGISQYYTVQKKQAA